MKNRKSSIWWILILSILLGTGSNALASVTDELFSNIDSVVFMVDVTRSPGEPSGSGFNAQCFAPMKTLLATALSNLEPDCRFAILANNGSGIVSTGTRLATAENVSDALQWAGRLSSVTGPDIFQAVAESGVPPYDECMNCVLISRGVLDNVYWETDQPTTQLIMSALPGTPRFTSILIPGEGYEFSAPFLELCGELAGSTGGRVIVLE